MTDEEKEKFKTAPDGLPYRFLAIWALSAQEPDNPWNDKMSEEMHGMINAWENKETYKMDDSIPETHQPIEMTEEKFRKIFYDNKEETPWIIVLLKKWRSQPQFYHSDYTMNSMKVLADYYRGKVRFAYVDVIKQETLKETFGVKTVPQNFFIKDGMVYEMGALQLQANLIRKFIEGDYLKDNMVY